MKKSINWMGAVLNLLCNISIAFADNCASNQPAVVKQLIENGAVISQEIQMDFGKIQKSSGCYLEAWPKNTGQVAKLVQIAYMNHFPIRTQGASHSENGSSLPHQFELLIHTARLNQLEFDHVGRVTAGAGIPVSLANEAIIANSSFFMPVATHGNAPTLGGYISAAGIGYNSIQYGGFWEHVYSITLVTGYGKILHVTKHDPEFAYLFGSMGQLGIITEVELNLLPDETKSFSYPAGKILTLTFPYTHGNYWTKSATSTPIYWFNIFAPIANSQQVQQELLALDAKYPHALETNQIAIGQVTFISWMPPLIYDKNQTFLAISLMSHHGNYPDSLEQLEKLEKDFTALVLQKHYKRYIQAELSASPELYQKYFTPEVYAEFKKLKTRLDPEFLFDQGMVFTRSTS